jgi:hypothetical protein
MFSPPIGPNGGVKNAPQQQSNQNMEFGFKPGTLMVMRTSGFNIGSFC